jgi:hypothetical protein
MRPDQENDRREQSRRFSYDSNLPELQSGGTLSCMNIDMDAVIEVAATVVFLMFLFAGTVYAYVAGPIPFIQ